MSNLENIQNFRIRDVKGNVKKYRKGDIVRKNGKQYIAIKSIKGYSPEHGEKRGWKEINENRITKFTKSNTAPKIPEEGDHWFDSSIGVLFIYVKNSSNKTSQWVEI